MWVSLTYAARPRGRPIEALRAERRSLLLVEQYRALAVAEYVYILHKGPSGFRR